jgi:hypothetical protein
MRHDCGGRHSRRGLQRRLGDSLNVPELTWTTSGDVPWFFESTNTYDRVAAAQSEQTRKDAPVKCLIVSATIIFARC